MIHLDSPVGVLVAMASDSHLLSLGFAGDGCWKSEVERDLNDPLISIKYELADYFAGKLYYFKTPILFSGSNYQTNAWSVLVDIPYGKTLSYREQASLVGNPKAYRSVAQANAANKLAIIVPCHRVINSDSSVGGYRGGIKRKIWLLEHEAHTSYDLN
jgi:O-6-methylguanine DNA methyltransferase